MSMNGNEAGTFKLLQETKYLKRSIQFKDF